MHQLILRLLPSYENAYGFWGFGGPKPSIILFNNSLRSCVSSAEFLYLTIDRKRFNRVISVGAAFSIIVWSFNNTAKNIRFWVFQTEYF